ncbi:MAG: response regulator [Bacteroidota bacterium]
MAEFEYPAVDFSKFTVLIVDDEEPYRKFLSKIIGKHLKATTDTAANPKEAFEYMKEKIPDLVLLDMQMPIMDGYTTLKKMRESNMLKDVPVIVCTALIYKELLLKLAQLDIDAYILKPSDIKTILDKVYNSLKKIKDKKNKPEDK